MQFSQQLTLPWLKSSLNISTLRRSFRSIIHNNIKDKQVDEGPFRDLQKEPFAKSAHQRKYE